MPRSRIAVAVATPADVPHLIDLWGQVSVTSVPHAGVDEIGMATRFAAAITDERCVLLVARHDATPVGMTMITLAPLTALTDSVTAQLDHTVVAMAFRRRGVGRALMAAAAAVADEAGAGQIAVSVSPMSRDANRFLARLGFGPSVVLRTAPLPGLRRRLAALEPDARLRDPIGVRRSRSVAHTRVRAALHRIAVTAPVPAATPATITLPEAGVKHTVARH